jgi:hypothetical protein
MPHVLFGVLISYSIGNALIGSWFHMRIKLKKLPHLPAILRGRNCIETAESKYSIDDWETF